MASGTTSVHGASGELRGTQSFVRVMQWCWRHPGVVALEVAWRWVFGVVALWLIWRLVLPRVVEGAGPGALGQLESLSLLEPTRAVTTLVALGRAVWPAMHQVGVMLGLGLALLWVVCSTVGRWFVLRRAGLAAAGRRWLGETAVLQALRLAALAAVTGGWLLLLWMAARSELLGPIAAGQEPGLVSFFAVAILGTLLLFVGWSLVSYAVSLPPLVAMSGGLCLGESLREGQAAGSLRMKLIEINLVMGIVKVALIVLLMVFSASPLPFQSVVTTDFLVWWSCGLTLLYCVASDFFHVARQIACLRLWEYFRRGLTVG